TFPGRHLLGGLPLSLLTFLPGSLDPDRQVRAVDAELAGSFRDGPALVEDPFDRPLITTLGRPAFITLLHSQRSPRNDEAVEPPGIEPGSGTMRLGPTAPSKPPRPQQTKGRGGPQPAPPAFHPQGGLQTDHPHKPTQTLSTGTVNKKGLPSFGQARKHPLTCTQSPS